jgi:hypothetical protein
MAKYNINDGGEAAGPLEHGGIQNGKVANLEIWLNERRSFVGETHVFNHAVQ